MLKALIPSILCCLNVFSTTLTFEGLEDTSPVGEFYSPLGLLVTGATAFIDSDDLGSGDFGGEPSISTAAFSISGILIDAPLGLTGRIQFYFSNPYGTTNVRLYEDQGLHGKLLFDALLSATPLNGSPDPTGRFSPFILSIAEFSGVAKSLAIVPRAPNGLFIDDLTITHIPEPQSLWLLAIPLLGLLAYRAVQRLRPVPQITNNIAAAV